MPTEDRTDGRTESAEDRGSERRAIRQRLGLDHPVFAIEADLTAALEAAPRGYLFGRNGLCSGYPLRPLPDRYFIAQEFSANRDDLREALTAALAELGLTPIAADDALWAGHILCKISALIQSTPFGVYQLSVAQNRNVYLELGIALGLGRPFVLVKEAGAAVPPLAEGLEYFPLNSYVEFRHEFGGRVGPYLADIVGHRTAPLPDAGSERTAVIAHGGLDALDFCVTMSRALSRYNVKPVILGDPAGDIAMYLRHEGLEHCVVGGAGRVELDETLAAVQAARFGVYRIEKAAATDAFLALGLSIGLGRPGFLVHAAQREIPADVQGLNSLAFTSYNKLGDSFLARYGGLLSKYA